MDEMKFLFDMQTDIDSILVMCWYITKYIHACFFFKYNIKLVLLNPETKVCVSKQHVFVFLFKQRPHLLASEMKNLQM